MSRGTVPDAPCCDHKHNRIVAEHAEMDRMAQMVMSQGAHFKRVDIGAWRVGAAVCRPQATGMLAPSLSRPRRRAALACRSLSLPGASPPATAAVGIRSSELGAALNMALSGFPLCMSRRPCHTSRTLCHTSRVRHDHASLHRCILHPVSRSLPRHVARGTQPQRQGAWQLTCTCSNTQRTVLMVPVTK